MYHNDHPPEHVHVLGPGWAVVVDLRSLKVRQSLMAGDRLARRVVETVAEHREHLFDKWKEMHG